MTPSSLSICVCTKDRPRVLRRCLNSIFAASRLPDAVLVSIDGVDSSEVVELRDLFPQVTFLQGPRRGLCANRNHVIRHATTDYISLIDDDGIVGADFVDKALQLLKELPDKVLVTGRLSDNGQIVLPRNPSFLGFFGDDPGDNYRTIHLNTNLLPRRAFDEAEFDENIVYGYEDMDLCSQLIARGYRIRYEPQLLNLHSAANPDNPVPKYRLIQRERERFYTSLRRYFLWEHRPLVGLAYIFVAPLHRIAHDLKICDWDDMRHCIPDLLAAISGVVRAKRRLRSEAAPKSVTKSLPHLT